VVVLHPEERRYLYKVWQLISNLDLRHQRELQQQTPTLGLGQYVLNVTTSFEASENSQRICFRHSFEQVKQLFVSNALVA
jgi:hypothetical protein